MQIIRSKKTIDRLNNHRFFNPSKLIAIAEKKAQIKQTPPKKEIEKQLDLFSNQGLTFYYSGAILYT